jgi:hypothetical protein
MKGILVACLLLALSGCATNAKFQASLNSWVGQPAQSLVDSWGYPASQMTAPNGNTVYVYQRSGSFVMPSTTTTNASATAYGNQAYGTATSTTSGGNVINMACTTYFELDSSQTIVTWHAQGNNCRSR